MLNKIHSLFHILSIGTIINSLHGYSNYSNLCDSVNNNEKKLPELQELVTDFTNQNAKYLHQEMPDSTPQFGDIFDFIVIGAGTAGATIAARLSQILQVKVLLIEAGFHENLSMDIPLLAPFLQLNKNINWNYSTKSVENRYCRGMEDNTCLWPAGKVAGGSSVLNYMIANRGDAENYDCWKKMGNKGWAYKDVRKYFKKLETMDIPELKSNTAYHGTDGPVHITYPTFRTPIAEAFLKAGEALGYPRVDYNAKREIGFSYVQTTIMNGTRMSSNRAYLHPIRDRKNLYMTFQSTVTKVLINATNHAIGVKFIKNGRNISVFANKEVILCAGAIKSPQLLMLSGIGPSKHLTELDIDVVKNAPVGENLMDHLGFYGLTWTINSSIGLQLSDIMNSTNSYMADFLINRKGPFTSPASCEAVAFVNTKYPEKRNGIPDMELTLFSGKLKDVKLATAINLKDPLFHKWTKYNDSYGWSIIPILLKPKSRGRIMLRANDINVKPEIVPNYFDHPDDVRTMIAGIRFAIRLVQTKAMQAFNSQLLNITYSGCNDYEYDSDAYWECAIRIISSTIYHYSGTCKMGAREDPTAVVDPKLKVIGIQGLRVADASIMPDIPSAHTSIPVYMIAEKAADMIKADWKSRNSNKLL